MSRSHEASLTHLVVAPFAERGYRLISIPEGTKNRQGNLLAPASCRDCVLFTRLFSFFTESAPEPVSYRSLQSPYVERFCAGPASRLLLSTQKRMVKVMVPVL